MSRAIPFVVGFLVASGLATAGWFLRGEPSLVASRDAIRDAEETARRARREASDASIEAQVERDRRRSAEERVKELERSMTGGAPPVATSAKPDAGHGGMRRPDAPTEWDFARVRQEIDYIGNAGAAVAKHPRLALVAEAMAVRPEESARYLGDLLQSNLPAGYVAAAGHLAALLSSADALPAVMKRADVEKDPVVVTALARAMAVIPGNAQVERLRKIALDLAAPAAARGHAIEGLGRRMDVAAQAAARGGGDIADDPRFRLRALVGVHDAVAAGQWKDASALPIFAHGLRTGQTFGIRLLCLETLEGWWSEDAAKALDAWAATPEADPQLAGRAKAAAAAIRAKAARPADAGALDPGFRQTED
ncbi:MAG: hypothetical protein HMLKMBBP_02098 [Planctomycetes bacterium]|nr:hypothetical protein [Planctomycetota bacterium]